MNTYTQSLSFLNDDCFRHMISYLPLKDFAACGQVNQRWRRISRNPLTVSVQFPILRTDQAPLLASNGFVALVNAAGHYLKKLSLKKCHAMTKSALRSLDLSTSSVSIKNCPKATVSNLSKVLSKLVSPARIRIGRGTSVNLFDFFSLCARNNIRLQKLDVSKASADEDSRTCVPSFYELNRETFCTLIDKNLLHSPCHLDLRNELWVNDAVLDKLKTLPSVAFSFLGVCLQKYVHYDSIAKLCQIISSVKFTNPCVIKSNIKMGDEVLDAIILKKLVLKSLNLAGPIDSNKLTTVFESHLASSCRLKLNSDTLNTEQVEVLVRKNITIEHLHFKTFTPFHTEQNLVALTNLFQNVPIKTLEIQSFTATTTNMDRFVDCLLNLKDNLNPPHSILIRNIPPFQRHHFMKLINAGIIKGNNFELALDCDWIDDTVIQALAAVEGLRFNKFSLMGNLQQYQLTPLLLTKPFENCHTFYPEYGALFPGQYVLHLRDIVRLRSCVYRLPIGVKIN